MIQRHVKVILSRMQKSTKTHSVRAKLMRHCTFFDSRKRYFGTLTLVKMPALPMRELMPCEVDSLKNANTRLPQNRYVV